MPGVTCEACHGPGAKHVNLMDEEKPAEARLAIFNPRRLNPVALVDFCGACHRTWNDVYEMGATAAAATSEPAMSASSTRAFNRTV